MANWRASTYPDNRGIHYSGKNKHKQAKNIVSRWEYGPKVARASFLTVVGNLELF